MEHAVRERRFLLMTIESINSRRRVLQRSCSDRAMQASSRGFATWRTVGWPLARLADAHLAGLPMRAGEEGGLARGKLAV
eukprot:551710-Pleurochrysis_carterae.AAC.1